MNSKIATLFSVRSALDRIKSDRDGILEVVNHLFDKGRESIVISGIFRQLYREGESNSIEFYNELFYFCNNIDVASDNESKEIEARMNKPICGQFSEIYDSLMCQIGSYLETGEIFRTFQRINRRFFQMGMKPEIFIEWGFDFYSQCRYTGTKLNSILCTNETSRDQWWMKNDLPKFDMTPILNKSKLKRFHVTASNVEWVERTDFTPMSSLEHLESDGMMHEAYGNQVAQCFMSLWHKNETQSNVTSLRFTQASCDVIDLFKALQSNGVKRIDFNGFYLLSNDTEGDRENLDIFLQIIMPLSPKEIELRDRLKLETKHEMKQLQQSWEVEKVKKQIENEIDCKYDSKFDENELSFCENKPFSSLEILSLNDCRVVSYQPMPQPGMLRYCDKQLDSQRIKSSLAKLKGLALTNEDCSIFGRISSAILNNITNQLRSLHIDNLSIGYVCNDWKFIKNRYPCAKENKTKSWFPANLQELCFQLAGDPTQESYRFWYRINPNTFPQLKRLRVVDCDNRDDYLLDHILIQNISSLVGNGLQSLELGFFNNLLNDVNVSGKYGRIGIDRMLKIVGAGLVEAKTGGIDISTNYSFSNNFILKLQFNVRLDSYTYEDDGTVYCDDDLSQSWVDDISLRLLNIVSSLDVIYSDFMFGFKLVFDNVNDKDHIFGILRQTLDNHPTYQGSTKQKCSVDKQLKHERDSIMLVVTFKKFNVGRDNSCSVTNFCNMDPNFEFDCDGCCHRGAWTEMY